MAQALIHRKGGFFKTVVYVQANPGAKITLQHTTKENKTYSAYANKETGLAEITVKNKGTYTITSNWDDDGAPASVNNSQIVVVDDNTPLAYHIIINNHFSSFEQNFRVSQDYKSKSLLLIFNSSDFTSNEYFTDFVLYRNNEAIANFISFTEYYIWLTDETVNGYLDENLDTSTEYTYSLKARLFVNDNAYYSAETLYPENNDVAPEDHSAALTVQANPAATITVSASDGHDFSFSEAVSADSTTGIASFVLPEFCDYSIATSSTLSENAQNNNYTVKHNDISTTSYDRQVVKMGFGISSFSADNTFKTNQLLLAWGGSSFQPPTGVTSYFICCSDVSLASLQAGNIDRTIKNTGGKQTNSSGTIKWGTYDSVDTTHAMGYYSIVSVLTINNIDFYSQKVLYTQGSEDSHIGTLTVTANPGATITAKSGSNSVSAAANASGVVTLTLSEYGTYTLTSSCSASVAAYGNTSSITHTTNGGSYTAQYVKLNEGSISASTIGVTNQYRSCSLLFYWGSSSTSPAPSSYFTNYRVSYVANTINTTGKINNTGSGGKMGTDLATGKGTAYSITSSNIKWGYEQRDTTNLASGTKRSYYLTAYITIGGVNYYSSNVYTAGGTSTTFIGQSAKFTKNSTYTMPAGWRQIQVFAVGGGGGGGGTPEGHSTDGGGGGGGGGYTKTATVSVTPGAIYDVIIGSGGTGGYYGSLATHNTTTTGVNGGQTSGFGVKASGGYGGVGTGYATTSEYYSSEGKGGNGGSGGGGGGKAGDGGENYTDGPGIGGAGGTNGGDGAEGKVWKAKEEKYEYLSGTAGTGQGTITRLYSNESSTLYAGGGGGGGDISGNTFTLTGSNASGNGGAGGSGGGGAGASSYGNGGNGTANTGGGGGGSAQNSEGAYSGGAGGSGYLVFRVVG